MKQTYPQSNQFSGTSASTSVPTELRGMSPVDLVAAERQGEIARLFFAGTDIQPLSRNFAVGYKFIQSAIRAQYRAELARVR